MTTESFGYCEMMCIIKPGFACRKSRRSDARLPASWKAVAPKVCLMAVRGSTDTWNYLRVSEQSFYCYRTCQALDSHYIRSPYSMRSNNQVTYWQWLGGLCPCPADYLLRGWHTCQCTLFILDAVDYHLGPWQFSALFVKSGSEQLSVLVLEHPYQHSH